MQNSGALSRYFKYFRIPSTIDVAYSARGLLAIAVIYWHTVGYAIATARPGWVVPGRLAVWIFFILSGYLIGTGFVTRRYEFTADGLASYFKQRFLRIYPIFFVVSLVALFANQLGPEPITLDPGFFLREILMLQFENSYRLNGVFWTLGIEAQFYFFCPLLLWLQMRRNGSTLAISAYFAMCLAFYFFCKFAPANWLDLRNLPGNLLHFQAGILIAFLRKDISRFLSGRSTPGWAVALAAATLGLLFYCNYLYQENLNHFFGYRGALATDLLGMTILCLHILVEDRQISTGPLASILALLGTFSYGNYAWHGILPTLLPSTSGHFIRSVALTVLLTLTSYVILERRIFAIRSKRRAPANMATAVSASP